MKQHSKDSKNVRALLLTTIFSLLSIIVALVVTILRMDKALSAEQPAAISATEISLAVAEPDTEDAASVSLPVVTPSPTPYVVENASQYGIEMRSPSPEEDEATPLLSASFMFTALKPPDYITDYSKLIEDGVLGGLSFDTSVFTLVNDSVYTDDTRVPGYNTPDVNSESVCTLHRNSEYARIAVSDSGWSMVQLQNSERTVYVENTRIHLTKPVGDITTLDQIEVDPTPTPDPSATPQPPKRYNSDGLYLYATVRDIPVYVGDDVSSTFIRKYIEDIEELPDILANPSNIKSVNITTEDLKERFSSLAHIKTRVIGVTSMGNGSIWINGNLYARTTILHEAVHVWDVITNSRISSSEEFKAIYAEEKGAVDVSPGNNVNAMEFLASSAEIYYDSAYRLRNAAPKTYAFLREHLA